MDSEFRTVFLLKPIIGTTLPGEGIKIIVRKKLGLSK